LQPLIRDDRVIVYIDDILIPSNNVEENLDVLKQTLLLLKSYEFTLNYSKCKFLRKTIEYLGYVVSPSGITLSDRHVNAVKNFPKPRNEHELQRFLGLTSYFRKFIPNFASIAKPLHNLLRKTDEFQFDNQCVEAFNKLKDHLISFPVLRLYNPTLETELRTDVSIIALVAILIQR